MIEKLEEWALIRFDLFEEMTMKKLAIGEQYAAN
jgi:hypothetical protein